MGGVDAVNEVYLSRPEDIRRMVRKRLEIFKPGEGYILDGSNSLVWETPAENVRAFAEAGLQYGRY
jgi:uroporphyrinogen-III decarboxylase